MTVPTFPTLNGIEWPVVRTPMWSTIKQEAVAGTRAHYAVWSYPKYQYRLKYSKLKADNASLEWQTLVGFYNSVNGAAQLFKFKDEADYSVTDQPFGLGDGSTKDFQLVRGLGGFSEPIFCPDASPTIKVAGITTAATVSDLGVVTFDTAPANGALLTWTGTYKWYCRFDEDAAEFENFAYQFWELGEITFTTEKF